MTHKLIDRQKNEQTERQMNGWAERQTGRQTKDQQGDRKREDIFTEKFTLWKAEREISI